MKSLVIVESPAKVKTIGKYLGADYIVKASMGHIADLPKSELGVEVDKKYEPKYLLTKKKVLQTLKKSMEDCDKLIIASDPDREGEAIGWHVAQRLKVIDKKGKVIDKGKKFERIIFTSITKDAVVDAIHNPRNIDMNLVDAQQARRVLDRLVGYKLSPLIWKKIMFGLSAGRVQSVAVRLIVEREEEREKFQPKEFWVILADLSKEKGSVEYKIRKQDEILENFKFENIQFELDKIGGKKAEVSTESEADKIISDVKDKKWTIDEITKSESSRYPKPPFITSTIQQTAANLFGFTSKRTMSVAQKLYESGNITYMRTDSPSIVPNEIAKIRSYVGSSFGEKYLNPETIVFKTKSKTAQEAHEAIRPTDITKNSESIGLSGDEKKLYDLIRNRVLACQMLPAKIENMNVYIKVGDYTFKSEGQRVVFDGYLKVYPERISENIIPILNKGEELFLRKILGDQRFTKPQSRYTEATLIKALEKFGVGRPSTYASIISTIQARKYVEKDGKYFFTTIIGRVVNKLLVKYFNDIVDIGFTAQMENKLDDIAAGDVNWVATIDNFYVPFIKEVEDGEKNIGRDEFTVLGSSEEKCPICGKNMIQKLGRYGAFLSCSDFPKCKGMKSLEGETKEEIQAKASSEEFLQTYEPAPKTEDGRDYILRKGRFGEFWAHPDYPKVKDIQSLKLRPEKFKEKYGDAPKTEDGRDYVLRRGRFGEFWAHPDYPKVKDIKKLKIKN